MRKLMITAVIALAIASISGCVKDSGPDGNANIENYTYTIQSEQWYFQGTQGQPGWQYFCQISVPAITQAVLEKGAVLVYVKENDLVYPLPATYNYESWITTYQYNIYPGLVEIFVEDTDFQTERPGMMIFKIVIFDQLKSLPASLDLKDYKQVLAYINK
jgi:hypothetical protein